MCVDWLDTEIGMDNQHRNTISQLALAQGTGASQTGMRVRPPGVFPVRLLNKDLNCTTIHTSRSQVQEMGLANIGENLSRVVRRHSRSARVLTYIALSCSQA